MENELILYTTCIVQPHIWIIPSSFTLTRNHVIQVGRYSTDYEWVLEHSAKVYASDGRLGQDTASL